MLVDSHCHLDFPDYAEEGVEIFVQRAKDRGVGYLQTISTHISKFNSVRSIAEKFPNVFCSVGVHPHHAAEPAEQFTTAQIVELSQHPKVIGIGECGLDYHYDYAPREVQADVFRKQLRACLETNLPVIVHTREAEEDTLRILEEERAGQPLNILLHCFTSSPGMANRAIDLGYYFSFSGIITFPKSVELREIVKQVPLERILVETDAPFLAPPPYRGKRNEPAYVVHIAEKLAEIFETTPEKIAAQTTDNFFRLFKKAKK